MKNFKELKIWQKGFEIAAKSFKLDEMLQTLNEEQRMLSAFMGKLAK